MSSSPQHGCVWSSNMSNMNLQSGLQDCCALRRKIELEFLLDIQSGTDVSLDLGHMLVESRTNTLSMQDTHAGDKWNL